MSKSRRSNLFRVRTVLMISCLAVLAAVGWFGGKQFEYSSSLSATKTAWAKGDPKLIVANANLALARSLDNAERSQAYYWLGVGYFNSNDLGTAVAYAQKAIELNKANGEPYVTLGLVDVRVGNLTAAKSEAATALKLAPDFGWAYNLTAIVSYAGGDKATAIADETKALKLDPGQAVLKQNLKSFSQ